jgi:hypothetical protein
VAVSSKRPAALVGAVRYNPYRAPTFEASYEGSAWHPVAAWPLVSFLPNGTCHLGSNHA